MNNEWREAGNATDSWDGSRPLEGIYVARKQGVGPNKSNMYMVKTATGELGVWGSTVIDNKFSEIPVGSEVRVEFKGMASNKAGNKQYKDYVIQYRPTPFLEAGLRPDSPAASGPVSAPAVTNDDLPPVDNYEGLGL